MQGRFLANDFLTMYPLPTMSYLVDENNESLRPFLCLLINSRCVCFKVMQRSASRWQSATRCSGSHEHHVAEELNLKAIEEAPVVVLFTNDSSAQSSLSLKNVGIEPFIAHVALEAAVPQWTRKLVPYLEDSCGRQSKWAEKAGAGFLSKYLSCSFLCRFVRVWTPRLF